MQAGGGGAAELLGDLRSQDAQRRGLIVVRGENGGERERCGGGIVVSAVDQDTGQQRESPLVPRATDSPFTCFFWVVKCRLTEVAAWIWEIGAWTRFRRRCPMNKRTSARVKAASSLVVQVYSPGWRRK